MKSNKKEVLILGGSGYWGRELSSFIGKEKTLQTYFKNKVNEGILFNLEKDSIKEILKINKQLKYIIFGAGMFNFSEINKNPSRSFFYNVDCTKRIIDQIKNINVKFVFLSSESVFDGKKGSYIETDSTNPIFEYGKQKDFIEKYILSCLKDFLIIRLSKVYDLDLNGNKLIGNWYKKLKKNEDIWCANDNIFSPIQLTEACKIINDLIYKDARGIFHASSFKSYNRKDMLNIFLSKYLLKHKYKGKIKYKSLNEFKGAEKQPLNTSLLPSKMMKTINFNPKNIQEWINTINF